MAYRPMVDDELSSGGDEAFPPSPRRGATCCSVPQPSRMYRDEAADLLRSMGLSTPEEASSSGDNVRVVPEEGIAALSAAMALLGGAEAGVGGEVSRCSAA